MSKVATKNEAKARKSEPKLSGRGALRMYRGSLGSGAVTYYRCGVVRRARERGVNLIVVDAKAQKEKIVAALPKHREDLFGVYTDKARANQGKYIDRKAFSLPDSVDADGNPQIGGHILGAQYVNPYLADERCNASIINTMLLDAGLPKLRGLRAQMLRNDEHGEHLHWLGQRQNFDGLVASPWRTFRELFDLARKHNSKLVSWLRQVQSQKEGVKEHMTPFEKFVHNIGVMRRAREVFNIATGEHSYKGGVTPYAIPLEQCEFAIDFAYLTNGCEVKKSSDGEYVEEKGDYYVRIVVGRRVPHVLYRRDWAGLSVNDRMAYLSEEVRQQVIAAQNQIKEKAKAPRSSRMPKLKAGPS